MFAMSNMTRLPTCCTLLLLAAVLGAAVADEIAPATATIGVDAGGDLMANAPGDAAIDHGTSDTTSDRRDRQDAFLERYKAFLADKNARPDDDGDVSILLEPRDEQAQVDNGDAGDPEEEDLPPDTADDANDEDSTKEDGDPNDDDDDDPTKEDHGRSDDDRLTRHKRTAAHAKKAVEDAREFVRARRATARAERKKIHARHDAKRERVAAKARAARERAAAAQRAAMRKVRKKP